MSKVKVRDKLNEHRLDICKAFNDGKNYKDSVAKIKEVCLSAGLNNEAEQNQQIIAFLLHNSQDLNLTKIGEYLSEPDDNLESKAMRTEWIQQLDFNGKSFANSLREYLQPFKLPGEAQKIDRLMEVFGRRYVEQHPGEMANSDAAYVLAFATVMLNTDAHSAAVKKKMTLEGFKNQNKGVNDGKDFSPAFLEQLYNEIKSNEIKLDFMPTSTRNPRKFELNPDQLANDPTFKKFSSLKDIKEPDGSEIDPSEIEGKKPWYSFFTGYKIKIQMGVEATGNANLEISKPSLWGRLFRGEKPKASIYPVGDNGKEPRAVDIEMAAKVASMFSSDVVSSKATYAYQRDEMAKAYGAAEVTNGKKRTIPEFAPKVEAPATPPAPQLYFPDLSQAPDIFGLQPQEAVAPKPRVTELPPVPIAVPIPKAKGPAPIAVPIPDEMDVAKPKVHKRRASFAEETKAQKAEAKPRRNSI